MKRLHNQTKQTLRWSMGGREYTCEPFGSIELPDELVEPCKSRGLPLQVAPVAPETKAKVTLDAETEAAKKEEARVLRLQLEEVRAAEATAKNTAENLQAELTKAQKIGAKLEKELASVTERATTLDGDKDAAEKLLVETVAKLQVAEDALRTFKASELAGKASKPSPKG